jgi:hypothetical protein
LGGQENFQLAIAKKAKNISRWLIHNNFSEAPNIPFLLDLGLAKSFLVG